MIGFFAFLCHSLGSEYDGFRNKCPDAVNVMGSGGGWGFGFFLWLIKLLLFCFSLSKAWVRNMTKLGTSVPTLSTSWQPGPAGKRQLSSGQTVAATTSNNLWSKYCGNPVIWNVVTFKGRYYFRCTGIWSLHLGGRGITFGEGEGVALLYWEGWGGATPGNVSGALKLASTPEESLF